MKGIAVSSTPGDHPAASFRLDAEAIVDSYPDAAIIIDDAGALVAVNQRGDILVAALAGPQSEPLRALTAECAASGCVQSMALATTGAENIRHLQLVAFCAGDDRAGRAAVLILARDITLENNLTHALIDSRGRYKDLVECSSDFAWETDAGGHFCFISHHGGLGYAPAVLNQTHAEHLLHPDYPAPAASPFQADQRMEDVEVWLARDDGEAACMLISAVGVHDDRHRRIGSRGVCRDVTKARKMTAELAAARARQDLLHRIVKSMRDVVDPFETLPVAAERTARAAGADCCRIWLRENGSFESAATWAPVGDNSESVFEPLPAWLEAAVGDRGAATGAVCFTAAGVGYLAALTRHHNTVNGAICLAVADHEGWQSTGAELVAGVADHLGIVIEQIVRFNEIKRLSRIDHLTGLFNRKTFEHEVGQRLRHQRRSGNQGALLYLDLDHFKQVNDRFGHHHGDRVLRAFGDILRGKVRVMDVAARLGGDEFALWLEDTDEPGAAAKAREVLNQTAELAQLAGDTDPALSVSIGIAISDPARTVTLDDLTVMADRAMYRAKAAGRASFEIATKSPGVAAC